MKYKDIIKTIVAGQKLDSDNDKKKAYQKCIDYADKHYANSVDINPFLKEAANIFGQQYIVKNAIYGMTPCDGSEKSTLEYTEANGPTLTVNKSGLLFYANLFSNLAKSEMEGEHVHLWGNTHPMVGKTFPLTIYFEGDDWFKQKESVEVTDTKDDNKITERSINPNEIAGLVLTKPAPPTLSLTPMRFYRINRIRKFNGEKVWSKSIRESRDRLYIFTFLDDAREEISFAFDIDDSDILMLTSLDIERPQ